MNWKKTCKNCKKPGVLHYYTKWCEDCLMNVNMAEYVKSVIDSATSHKRTRAEVSVDKAWEQFKF